jgi:GGDEF domain-containing protein
MTPPVTCITRRAGGGEGHAGVPVAHATELLAEADEAMYAAKRAKAADQTD